MCLDSYALGKPIRGLHLAVNGLLIYYLEPSHQTSTEVHCLAEQRGKSKKLSGTVSVALHTQ